MSGLEIAVCMAAIVIGIGVKAVTGMGFPLIAIPVVALFVSVEDAVVVIALPNVIMNAVICWRTRRESLHTRDLPVLATASIVGAVIGTGLLVSMPERPLILALAFTVFAYVGYAVTRSEGQLSPQTTRRWSPAVGLVAGVMQGAVGISGPPVAAWIHAYRLPPSAFVFSVSLLFLVAGAVQLALFVGYGMLAGPRLWIALAAIPLVLGMIPLGERLRVRLGAHRFDRVVLAVLLLSGASLLVRAVTA